MGHFIENNLIPGEKILYKASVHWMVYFPVVINILIALAILLMSKFLIHSHSRFFAYVALVPLTVAMWKAVQAYFHRVYTEIGITNERLIVKFGVIGRETMELPLARIESVLVEQTVSERMIDAGSIGVRGTGISMAPVRYIEHPMIFRNHLNEAIQNAKQGGNN